MAEKKKYLVAVSGGIDSVVLLDMLVRDQNYELIVAHFDHGIRDDSADDARFVEALAKRYRLPFVTRREELGAGASEDRARTRRHAFLKEEARRHDAIVATAHHADDVIETIAINISRGTGWRGLAIMRDPSIERPLMTLTKHEIRMYALANRLEWVEDSTNASSLYLRNRIRARINQTLPLAKRELLLKLWRHQVDLRWQIGEEMRQYYHSDAEYGRYFFIQIDADLAKELLRYVVSRHADMPPTRPQADRAVLAIKTARAGTNFQIGGDVTLHFTERTFIVQTP